MPLWIAKIVCFLFGHKWKKLFPNSKKKHCARCYEVYR